MSEKNKQSGSMLKVLSPPLLYYVITMFVEVVMDLYLYFKQMGVGRKSGTDFFSSYKFLDSLQNNLEQYAYLITLFGALIAVVIFGILYIRESSFADNRIGRQFKSVNKKNILVMIGLGFFGGTGLGRFVFLLPIDNIIGSYEVTGSQLLNGNLFVQILSLAVIVPIAEELIYRGLVFLRLRKFMDAKKAMVIVSVMFGIFHLNLLQGVYAFLLSLLLVSVYIRYESIFLCIIIHSVANLASVLSNYFGISKMLNKNYFIYCFIMTAELTASAVLFLLCRKSGGGEQEQKN